MVIWFTGLSGSGKTTIAERLKDRLIALGKKVEVYDGDAVRNSKHKHLGFSRQAIKKNNQLIALMAKEALTKTDIVLVPVISPYREDRQRARSIIGDQFAELFVNAPLAKCIERDVKGLYKKALAGEITDFIGLSRANPYQPPDKPDIEIKTDKLDLHQSVQLIINFLKDKNLL